MLMNLFAIKACERATLVYFLNHVHVTIDDLRMRGKQHQSADDEYE